MGTDIIVIRPRRVLDSLDALNAEDVTDPLGTLAEMRERCLKAFPEIQWDTERYGLYLQKDGYAAEFSISPGPHPLSLHLTLRVGRSLNNGTYKSFRVQLFQLCSDAGWQAFALSDNSALFPMTERGASEAKE